MKHGVVVHIRVNPEDVMGAIDVARQSGVYVEGMSIAQVVRLTLGGLLESARRSGVIPSRDGFEYEAMMQPFMNVGRNGKKLQISHAVEVTELSRVMADKPASPVKINHTTVRVRDEITDVDRKRARVLVRLAELSERKRADPDNFTLDMQRQFEAFELAHKTLQEGVDLDVSELFARWS